MNNEKFKGFLVYNKRKSKRFNCHNAAGILLITINKKELELNCTLNNASLDGACISTNGEISLSECLGLEAILKTIKFEIPVSIVRIQANTDKTYNLGLKVLKEKVPYNTYVMSLEREALKQKSGLWDNKPL